MGSMCSGSESVDLGRGKGVRCDEALRPAPGKPSSLGK